MCSNMHTHTQNPEPQGTSESFQSWIRNNFHSSLLVPLGRPVIDFFNPLLSSLQTQPVLSQLFHFYVSLSSFLATRGHKPHPARPKSTKTFPLNQKPVKMTTLIQKHICEAESFHNVNFFSLMNKRPLVHINHVPNKGRKQSHFIQWIIQK